MLVRHLKPETKQTKWLINSVKHSFHLILIEGAAKSNLEFGVVEVPPTFQPQITTSESVFDDAEGRELGKTDFQSMMECTIRPRAGSLSDATVTFSFSCQ